MPDGLSGEEQAIYFSKVRGFFDSYACSRVMERRKKMSDYIRKADAVEETLKYIISSGVNNQSTWNECVRIIADTLQDMQPADVVQVVHGRWLPVVSYNNTYKCSECGRLLVDITDGLKMVAKHYPYCHYGAKMDGGENG